MKNQKLLRVLKEMGLSDNEAQVYLSALALGPSTVLKLAAEAGVKRTSVYSILTALKLKGLINEELRGMKMRYVAASPAALKALLAQRLASLEETLPELTGLYNLSGEGSIIRHYQGLAAVQGLYEELLRAVRPNDFYLVITDLAQWESRDKSFFRRFVKRRARKEVSLRILSAFSLVADKRRKQDEPYAGKVRVLPKDVPVTTNLIITPGQIVFHQLNAPFDAILLTNRSVIGLQKQMFDLIWNSTPAG